MQFTRSSRRSPTLKGYWLVLFFVLVASTWCFSSGSLRLHDHNVWITVFAVLGGARQTDSDAGTSLVKPLLKTSKNKKQHSPVVSPSCGALPLRIVSTHLDFLFLAVLSYNFQLKITTFLQNFFLKQHTNRSTSNGYLLRHHKCNWSRAGKSRAF